MPNMIWLLAAFGITFAAQNKIDFLRKSILDEMLKCSFCTGFHAGWMTWIMWKLVDKRHVDFLLEGMLSILIWSFASAAFCYSLDVLLQFLESKTNSD